MKWLELSVESPREFVEPLSEVFQRYGNGGVVVEEVCGHNVDEGDMVPDTNQIVLKTYLLVDSTTHDRRGLIDVGVRLMGQLAPVSSLHERLIEQDDWQNAWKNQFKVLCVGKRLVVAPTWHKYEANPSDLVIVLDPGLAFGTGHHPTTRMCLEILEDTITQGMDVLDVGSGSGILSIAAAKLGARSVLALDSDPVAVEVSQSNFCTNHVTDVATVIEGTLPHNQILPCSYDVVVANVSSKFIVDLSVDLISLVRLGGTLIASGTMQDKVDVVRQCLQQNPNYAHQVVKDGDWVTHVVEIP